MSAAYGLCCCKHRTFAVSAIGFDGHEELHCSIFNGSRESLSCLEVVLE